MPRPHSAALTAPRAKMPRSVGAVRELDPLAVRCEDHGVLADDAAAAQGGKADVAAPARAGVAVAHAHADVVELDAAALGGGLAEHQRRAGRGIDLVPVVHLEDLDVEVGVERFGDLAREGRQQVDAEAHVAGLDDGGVARGRGDLGLVRGRETGGADDVHDARVGGQPGEFDATLPAR